MLFEEIKEIAKSNNVYVFFDMDGVLAEFDISKNEDHSKNIKDYYLIKRPIVSNINYAKELSMIKNVNVCILSNCHHKEQKEDKIRWLKLYAPFIEEKNIHIICYEEIEFSKEDKYKLKKKYLEDLFINTDNIVYHIDDDIRIIKEMKKSDLINIKHVSSIIK